MTEREEIFRALVGSHNYNLNTPESDKDYKVFVLPTFEDLYYGRFYSENIVGKEVDTDTHDVRKLVDFFWKANPNFQELLFSKEIHTANFEKYQWFVDELLEMRDDIITMNLPKMFSSVRGMHFSRIKRLEKGTEGTQHLVDAHGYNTKEALHTYREPDLMIRFALNNFEDFGSALRYSDETAKALLNLRNGQFTRMQFDTIINLQFGKFIKLEAKFNSFKPRENVKKKLEDLIFNLIKTEAR